MLDKVKVFYWSLKEDTPVLRCVFGVTLALVVSTTLGYLVPHITAIFALMFLEPNKKPLGLKKEIGLVLGISFLGYFGVIFGKYLIDYPLVILLLLGLIIYWSFRYRKITRAYTIALFNIGGINSLYNIKGQYVGWYSVNGTAG